MRVPLALDNRCRQSDPSAVAYCTVTVCALAAESVTLKVAVSVPLSPSVIVVSPMLTSGLNPVEQSLIGEPLLRGLGVAVTKSARLSFVSVQPPDFRKLAMVLLLSVNAAGPAPS